MAISCVYCGASHATPAEVRACWSRSTSRRPQPTEPALPLATVPAASVPVRASAGPDALGRNVVVLAGTEPPPPWRDAPQVAVTEDVLANPSPTIARLRAAAAARERLVVVVHVPFPAEPVPALAVHRPLHELGPHFEVGTDVVHHLVWANSVDATDPLQPRWRPAERAVALGARPAAPDGPGDVVLTDGTPVWIDGGPLTHFGGPVAGAEVVPALMLAHGLLRALGSNTPGGTVAELAPDQEAAVTHPGGAARIIAPAGSGKTRVLTERARHLLARWGLPHRAVCLVAFNTRAQAEMRERTADLPDLQVRTLNSLALAVVNGTGPFARGPGSARRTVDEPEVRRILGTLVEVPRRRNTDPLAPFIDALSLARLGLVDPAEVEDRYDGDVAGFAEVFPAYRERLRRDGLLDFDEQIVAAVELLLDNPAARAAAQRACQVLLVDEFQDLAPAHLLFVRLLAGPALCVFGVGDDDQTIYGYQGADPAWLIEFASLFPGAGDHPLEVNYRCPEGVVAAADRLLRHNRRRVPKTIRAARTGTVGWSCTEADDTVAATVDAVRRALAAGWRPADIAVLTRVNALLAPVQVALHGAAPVVGGVGPEFVQRTAVRATLAWMRLATGTWRSDDLREALRRPSRPLHERVTDWVAEARDLGGLHRLAARLHTPRDADRVEGFATDIALLRARVAAGATTAQVLATLLDDIGLAGAVSTLDVSRRGMNRAAQHDDLTALVQLAHLQADPSQFATWLPDVLARRETPRTDAPPEGVTLATVHRVKGQEWPLVVVHEAAEHQFPHRLADDLEEERRLFHVALTRAGEQCVVVCPAGSPSPFVHELATEPSAEPSAEPAHPTPGTTRRAPGAPPSATDTPLRRKGQVLVGPGVVVVDQGTEWVVESVSAAGAVTRCGPASRVFKAGARVTTAGGASGVLTPLGADDPGEASVRAFDLLRGLRRRLAQGRPAYTVFDDATIERIALALPRELAALARIHGIGPAKLEQYGDLVLIAVEDASG